MKISQKLPQFENDPSLILVTGKQDAKIYRAQNGFISRNESFRLYKPRYSDREGFFMTRSSGKTVRSGSVYEDKENTLLRDFFAELSEKIKKQLDEYDIEHVYIFAPSKVLQEIKDMLPKQLQNKIYTNQGNYYNEHVFRILEKIQSHFKEKSPKIIKEESKKILQKVR